MYHCISCSIKLFKVSIFLKNRHFFTQERFNKSCQKTKQLAGKGFVCVEVLWPSQPNGVMSSAVSLPNHTFTGHA